MPGLARPLEVFARFARLGVTSFGGPVAHLGYFRRELVERAHWVDDAAFAEIVALCSALPGPSSSQVGIVLGAVRAGPLGAFLAWLAFTTPSALILALFGAAVRGTLGDASSWRDAPAAAGALEGLAAAAAAVVAVAVMQLARTLATTVPTRVIAVVSFALALVIDRYAPAFQWVPLAGGAAAGLLVLADGVRLPEGPPLLHVPPRAGLAAGVLLVAALALLPALAPPHSYLALFATFVRAGSLVFGGGHVVLPFLQATIAQEGIPVRDFFAGYGAAQSVPGPLFTFSAFLGAVDRMLPSSALGALVAVLGIFAPSFLLLTAAIPLWSALRRMPRAAAALAGINASVVGLLAAVLVDPIGRSLVGSPRAVAIALVCLALFLRLRWPAWLVVLLAAGAGAALRAV